MKLLSSFISKLAGTTKRCSEKKYHVHYTATLRGLLREPYQGLSVNEKKKKPSSS